MKIYGELETLCWNLACLRRREGLSRQEMAKLLGIGVESMKRVEEGILPPGLRVSVLYRAAGHFGISPADLLTPGLQEE